ncbi:DinB family protein [Longitalea luteola]|uniref:DinB family protein n=1 Tax=Longitalea luteola TaxID=2812563 RepID=UPI001A9694F2|nr:DinB family protein [Longitalea luteola]
MDQGTLGKTYLKELEAEVTATRKCLERIPVELFHYKPHEKSMELGYLTILVAEMPNWITTMIEQPEIDLATGQFFKPASTADVVKRFDENIQGAKNALNKVTDEALLEPFSLKRNGEVLYTAPKLGQIGSTLNHLVHHRGQLTVYMRLNDIPVPSIYGPSADEQKWQNDF